MPNCFCFNISATFLNMEYPLTDQPTIVIESIQKIDQRTFDYFYNLILNIHLLL